MKSEFLYLNEFESIGHFKRELEKIYVLLQYQTLQGQNSGSMPNSCPSSSLKI